MIYNKSDIPADLQKYFVRAELGLEPTPQEYVENMVEVFSLVRGLLTDDGTLWLNLGDSYSRREGPGGAGKQQTNAGAAGISRRPVPNGLKDKDLIGIPWRVAFALQADGWYLRQDIIWSKKNCMPESVTDRCTKSHEYIFLLSKSERYYFDHEAIKEPAKFAGEERSFSTTKKSGRVLDGSIGSGNERLGAPPIMISDNRNRRSVWEVATQPYSGAHFATFPPALIEPCILAGSRPGDVVFDPFLGSGTTAQVAQNLGRQWLGCELNGSYVGLQRERVKQQGLVFA